MTTFTDLFGDFLREHVNAGLSETGQNPPAKSQGRLIGPALDVAHATLLTALAGAGAVAKATRAELYADLAHGAGTMGFVLLDPTDALNGIYLKSGASGAGAWAITDLALPAGFATDLATALAGLETVAAAALSTAADAAQVAADKTIVTASSSAAVAAQAAAEAARDDALAYAELTGPFEFYATKAAADAALAGLPANQLVQVWADESQAGLRTIYQKVGGVYVLQTSLSYVTPSSTDTLSNKTFSGSTNFLLAGGRIVISSEAALPSSPVGLVQFQNENAFNVGALVNSFWEGSTALPYTNNDCTLFVTYNKTLSNSANRSWSASCSNNYNDIPVGVTDSGSRVGVIGWAASVPVAGYSHAGTLAEQYGVRGTAGFQGAGTPTTAVVQNAIGVEGLIIADSAGATINLAVAGRFITDGGVGVVQDNTAVYARAQNGTVANYSFFGAAGALYNADPIVCDDYVRGAQYLIGANVFADVDGTNHRIWSPGGDVRIYFGAAETLHRCAAHRFVSNDAATTYATFDGDGTRLPLPTYADNAAAVAAGKAVSTLYKTATGETRIVV